MHGLHVARMRSSKWLRIGSSVAFVLTATVVVAEKISVPDEDGTAASLSVTIDADLVTLLECHVEIKGTLITPAAEGVRQWELDSAADFTFAQRQLPSKLSGPVALQAIRKYSQASTVTRVGKDHETKTSLPQTSSLIFVKGTSGGLNVAAAAHTLSRGEFDLLQMPCDPLPCASLLPSREVAVGEKWNTDSWVLPRLAGLEAATDHSLTCQLKSLEGDVAQIHFVGTAKGAVLGSASEVELSGTLTLNTSDRLLTELKCEMKEQRSAGPVSPGLNATVSIGWTQKVIHTDEVPSEINESRFAHPLALQTPWRLTFHHSKEWHIFNQTDQVLMLRQIRDGALISQCNISAGIVMPPGQYTPDQDFRSDVRSAIQARGGRIIAEDTIRTDNKWRIRHVQASGNSSDLEVIWDYYLCTAASGEQFSLLFSHSKNDAIPFGDEPKRLLSNLSLAGRRPALPFR